ncbi:PREDICTED: G-type lectin S-receptor-like serine/threonine-protein kinase At4g27290-like [Fragaria vesca subsp. vesca]
MNNLCFILLCVCFSKLSSAADTLSSSQNITDGNSSLVSPGGVFELGFFTPGLSKSRYLGIWYKNIPVKTVVWVANRGAPINDSSGHLMINTTTGTLVLLNKNKTVFWSSNSTKQTQNISPVVQLLDNGNLILRDEKEGANAGNYLWQSFDYPSDTLLPGMKLGWDLRTRLNRKLTAWKSPDDPSPGDFTWELQLHNYPEPAMFRDGKVFLRSGPWNGVLFSGKPAKALPALNFSFVMDENEVYTTIGMVNNSALERMMLNLTADYNRQSWIWSEADRNWTLYAAFPRDPCDSYGKCGGNGNCELTASPLCQCLDRFKPRSVEKWSLNNFSLGCKRKTPLTCKNDGFVTYPGLKLPDTTHTWIDKAMNLKECRAKCLSNCSCSAYTNLDVRGGGSGCAIWFDDLVDLKQIPGGDQDIYIKISGAELGGKDEKWKIGVIVASAVVVILAIILFGYCYILRLRHRKRFKGTQNNIEEQKEEDLELPLFDLSTIETATNNFSINNKLGEGGFGPVYKGTLIDGKEIAVKRLSKSSGQGMKEFKNEVILIAKLQHRNLVKLLGCCIQGMEKLLIYEYMPNKSLDSFIFDEVRRKLLDWHKRFNIICGIARGLLYLHQDSRLRIIHRDLKASNVLLDREMNPKISDFGLARTFGGDQTEGNTNRVVGTYGYMAPEYAIEGQFSVKSDVFSFGILMLEIISGKKSKGFYHLNHNLNLIGNAWRLWNGGRPLELIDEGFGESCNLSEVLRCIHVSLLCVQQQPEDRPTMSAVVQMLCSESALPQPKEPGFFSEKDLVEGGFPFLNNETSSNGLTITLLEALCLSLSLLKTSTSADSIPNHAGYELGFLNTPKGVHTRRSLLAPTSGDYCDNKDLCGSYSICIISSSQVCNCLEGFKPKAPDKYNNGQYSGGCDRTEALNCQNKDDGFVRYPGVKLPDPTDSRVNQSMSLEECRRNCLNNCSCVAYASSNVNGCTIWLGDLVNIKKLSNGGDDLYVRVPASELKANHSTKTKIVVIVASVVAVVIGMLLVAYCIHRRRTKFKEKMGKNGTANQNEDMELPIFSLSTIVTATDNFSFNKKLGEGGFGPVYKGTLADGQEIAVKRLSRSSGQGPTEFKNEVLLIAKLQHRNLVRLLGCCIEGEERLLIYEYMPNNSLDFYLFDENRARLLAWPQRFHIICGIARGLLYLHQDSRLRIIHRDLKASNVLLDKEMNPKISDFGMARTFGGDETEGVTRRVVGTYGYMAPEYAIDGLFSVKSDVFSFGILLLETLSGKRSRGFYDPVDNLNLIGHAWKLWKEGRSLELIDECLMYSCDLSEILGCFHISLLCVQELPEDRPNISTVVLMLGGGSALPQPKKPGFFVRKSSSEADSSSYKNETCSTNNETSSSKNHTYSNYDSTITVLEGR